MMASDRHAAKAMANLRLANMVIEQFVRCIRLIEPGTSLRTMDSPDGPLAALLGGVGLTGGLDLFARAGLLAGLRSLGSMAKARGDGRPKRRKTIAPRPYSTVLCTEEVPS